MSLKKQGQDLLAGTKNGELPEGFVGIPPKYPDQAAKRFQDGGALLDSLTKDIGDLTQSLQADKPYVAHNAAILALLKGSGGGAGYVSLLERARAEQSELSQLLEKAQKQIDDAALASKGGRQLVCRGPEPAEQEGSRRRKRPARQGRRGIYPVPGHCIHGLRGEANRQGYPGARAQKSWDCAHRWQMPRRRDGLQRSTRG